MGLAIDRTGHGPRLVLVHGFTQTRTSWAPLVGPLAARHEVLVVDAPGHGGSSDVRADLAEGADLLVDAAGAATYVGYSMGARLCLHAALAHPDLLAGLVLVSGTAGIESSAERVERRAADARLADHLDEVGLDAFLDEWLSLPLFAGLSPGAADRPGRRANTVTGLRSSLELAGTGTQAPLWDRLAELAMPVLVVAGAADTKFTALAERLATGIGDNARLKVVEGAGHTVHLERPAEFLAVLETWLSDNDL